MEKKINQRFVEKYKKNPEFKKHILEKNKKSYLKKKRIYKHAYQKRQEFTY